MIWKRESGGGKADGTGKCRSSICEYGGPELAVQMRQSLGRVALRESMHLLKTADAMPQTVSPDHSVT